MKCGAGYGLGLLIAADRAVALFHPIGVNGGRSLFGPFGKSMCGKILGQFGIMPRAGAFVPVSGFVLFPDLGVEFVRMRKHCNSFGPGCAADRTGKGLYALFGLGCGLRNFSAVICMLCKPALFRDMSAGRGMPVIRFVLFPDLGVEFVRMRKRVNRFGFTVSADFAGKGLYAFFGFGRLGRNFAVVKRVVLFL